MNIVRRRTRRAAEEAAFPLVQGSAEHDTAGAMQDGLSDLSARLEALTANRRAEKLDASHELLVKQNAALLNTMGVDMAKIAGGLRSLSDLAAHGAAHLDPNASARILDRMRNLGEATLRQIDGRIVTTVSREGRRELQILRDDMRNWLAVRDTLLEEAERAVQVLKARIGKLRNQCLAESGRFAKAAELVGQAAAAANSDPRVSQCRHASPEAAEFSASVRALLDDAGAAHGRASAAPIKTPQVSACG